MIIINHIIIDNKKNKKRTKQRMIADCSLPVKKKHSRHSKDDNMPFCICKIMKVLIRMIHLLLLFIKIIILFLQ